MKNFSIAFDILEGDEQTLPMHNYIPCHIVFDLKMDFTWKYLYVATGCHGTKYDKSCYVGVVSCENFRIYFTYAALNSNDVMEADIQKIYITVPCYDKYGAICGPKFGLKH